jgi:hypothetical protein
MKHVAVADPYMPVVAEIVGDERAPVWILDDAWTRFRSDASTMSSLAMNPNTDLGIVEQLRHHQNAGVREHAELILMRRQPGDETSKK